jgi:hypothetical protein
MSYNNENYGSGGRQGYGNDSYGGGRQNEYQQSNENDSYGGGSKAAATSTAAAANRGVTRTNPVAWVATTSLEEAGKSTAAV